MDDDGDNGGILFAGLAVTHLWANSGCSWKWFALYMAIGWALNMWQRWLTHRRAGRLESLKPRNTVL